MILILSVNDQGVVSLWDNEAIRNRGKEKHEVNVNLELVDDQEDTIIHAKLMSRSIKPTPGTPTDRSS